VPALTFRPYALLQVGRNGTGKTTLLRALAGHQVKGIPANMQVRIVQICGAGHQVLLGCSKPVCADRQSGQCGSLKMSGAKVVSIVRSLCALTGRRGSAAVSRCQEQRSSRLFEACVR
jgi:hypothetical protein